MKRVSTAALFSLVVFAAGVRAECSHEAMPTIPDGAKASEPELLATKAQINKYMESSTAYLSCIDAEIAAATKSQTKETADAVKAANAERTQKYNDAVAEQETLAANWGVAVKAYKAAQAK